MTTTVLANCSVAGTSNPVPTRSARTTNNELYPSGGTRSQISFERTVPVMRVTNAAAPCEAPDAAGIRETPTESIERVPP